MDKKEEDRMLVLPVSQHPLRFVGKVIEETLVWKTKDLGLKLTLAFNIIFLNLSISLPPMAFFCLSVKWENISDMGRLM